ncbi:hypothetical protein P8C59_005314 [Phyllachora maydis]|uniref:Pre-rRNA processing protein n=1 Tax=Phyllachora maydis TaxID=1825666 RepID=A0AAD9I427_9PEZI|nr:hypothetical protein P8C59_005314 [Phyllachora maydis]
MSDSERSSLLAKNVRPSSSAPAADDEFEESTPLLSRPDLIPRYDGDATAADGASGAQSLCSSTSVNYSAKKSRRWPSIFAMVLLAVLSLVIIILAFVVPAAVEEYAKEALVVEPTNLSLDSITAHGVRTRIQANVRLDGARVRNGNVRRVGRLATWLAKADIPLKSGFVPLGTHSVAESLTFEAKKLPGMPTFHLSRLNLNETTDPAQHRKIVSANVSVTAFNRFPVSLEVPILGFEVSVPGCDLVDPYILVADAVTTAIVVRPQSDVTANRYLSGQAAMVFVRGKKIPGSNMPDWLSEIMASMLVPVPFPGHSDDNMIRDFALSDVQLTMPDPMAEPGTGGSNPKVSGTVEVFEQQQMCFTKPRSLGNFTDVLADVIQSLLFGGKQVVLNVTALVDVRLDTVLGQVILKDVPASGEVPVKPLPQRQLEGLRPEIGNLEVVDTTASSMTLQAFVNLTNPTPYSAFIPAVSIHLLCNDTFIGEIIAEGLNITTGNNTDLQVKATPPWGRERRISTIHPTGYVPYVFVDGDVHPCITF